MPDLQFLQRPRRKTLAETIAERAGRPGNAFEIPNLIRPAPASLDESYGPAAPPEPYGPPLPTAIDRMEQERRQLDTPPTRKQSLLQAISQAAPIAAGALFGGSEGAYGAGQGVEQGLAEQTRQRELRRKTLSEEIEAQKNREERMGERQVVAQTAAAAQAEQAKRDAATIQNQKDVLAERSQYHQSLLTKPQLPGIERISGQMITAEDAQMLTNKFGSVFNDRQGKPIDVMSLPPHMGLSVISGGTPGQPRYEVVTQPTRNMTMDNVTSVVPSRTPLAPIVQGTARVPTVTTREEPAVSAAGEPVAQKLTTVSTPQGGIAQPTLPRLMPNPSARPSLLAPPVPPSPAPQGAGGIRPLGAMQSSELARQRAFATPVKTAAVQIFGDPQNPDFESLASFAHLADDAASRQRVGTAARLIIQNMAAAGGGSEGVGATLGGFGASANTGGLWGWLKNATGITSKIASSQASATDAAVSRLTPEEDRFLSRIFAAYGSISGLRSLTRGSAYKFSIESMERELPIPGLSNVQNAASYNAKLASLAEEIATGIDGAGISKQVLPQQDFYKQQAQLLTRLGKGVTANQSNGTQRYVDAGEVYNIPADKVQGFLKDHPRAQKQ